MLNIDWQGIFAPTVPVLEIFIRGTIMYLVLFALLRLTFKRIGGSIGLGMKGDGNITVISNR